MESMIDKNDNGEEINKINELMGNGEKDVLFSYLQIYIDVYKHHFTLFIRGASIYLIVIGVTFGYIFRIDNNISSAALSVFIVVVSLIVIIAIISCIKWLKCVEEITKKITIQIKSDLPPFPYFGAMRVGIAIVMLAFTFFIAGAVLSYHYFRQVIIEVARVIPT